MNGNYSKARKSRFSQIIESFTKESRSLVFVDESYFTSETEILKDVFF